jgi:hypothetical protein
MGAQLSLRFKDVTELLTFVACPQSKLHYICPCIVVVLMRHDSGSAFHRESE